MNKSLKIISWRTEQSYQHALGVNLGMLIFNSVLKSFTKFSMLPELHTIIVPVWMLELKIFFLH